MATGTTTTRTTTTMSGAPGDDSASSDTDFPSFEAVVDAYFDCRKHKRNSIEQLQFEISLESNLYTLWQHLKNGTYEIGPSQTFVVTKPKHREIWASSFRDRVVHHLLYNAISERFTRCFISDTYACLPGRGTLYGRYRLEQAARSITQGWTKAGYYLKMDIANFFNSIDHCILEGILLKRVTSNWMRGLTAKIIHHNPRQDPVIRSQRHLFEAIPKHKSYWRADPGKGLPIGNLTSQFFANVYLDILDQYVKHKLKPFFYGRYVDDLIILSRDPEKLIDIKNEISVFLQNELCLKIHPHKTEMNKIDKGINFTGYIIKPGRTYIRRSTVSNCHFKINNWEQRGSPVDKISLITVAQSVNSYLGMLRHVNGYNSRLSICRRFNNLFIYADHKSEKIITNL